MDVSNWRRNLRTKSSKDYKEPLPIYGVKTPEIENNSRYLSELGIPTNLAFKCCNLSLGDPNEMIIISTENRLIEISFS